MKRIKTAVVGCGSISDIYMTNLTNGKFTVMELVACSDLMVERMNASAAKFGIKAMSLDEICALARLPYAQRAAAIYKAFNVDLPDEAKPVYNRTCVLVTASGGGVALIRIADKKAMFYAKPGGNPHSAEVLPDGNVVVASSTGNLLSVYVYNGADSYVSRPAFTMPVHSAHNVVWDRKRGCLWTATGAQLLKLAYNGKRTAPELTQVRSYDMAAGNTDAHDLAPVCGEDAMYVSTNQHVYKFDCAAEKFLDVEIFQQNTIKSISTGPEGYSTIVMRPTSGGSNWWSAEVCDMKGNRLFNRAGYQIYKARWYVENPFGYPEVHTL